MTASMPLDQFLGAGGPEPPQVLPGLLAKGEAMMVTGRSGVGKSTLLRQFALTAAAGIGPFGGPAKPTSWRTLYVDLENPTGAVRRSLARLGASYAWPIGEGDPWTTRAHIVCKDTARGLDLASDDDADRLGQMVAECQPDLLLLGPAYRLYRMGNDGGHEQVAATLAVLDDIRQEYGCAIVLEAHSAGADGRPLGSPAWQWWPDLGIALGDCSARDTLTDQSVTVWRGPRNEAVDVPASLHRGRSLPFTVASSMPEGAR